MMANDGSREVIARFQDIQLREYEGVRETTAMRAGRPPQMVGAPRPGRIVMSGVMDQEDRGVTEGFDTADLKQAKALLDESG